MEPHLIGTGKFVPSNRVSSHNLEKELGLPDGWIEERTGIRERPVSQEYTTGDMAVKAAKKALEDSPISPERIGRTLLATSTPDQPLPPTAPDVQNRLNVSGGGVDLAGSCVGFLDALQLGSEILRADSEEYVLVIGANHLTYRLNWDDRNTAVLFADGAGAAVLGPPSETNRSSHSQFRITRVETGSDGSGPDSVRVPAGGSREPFTPEAWEKNRHLMEMRDGGDLFRKATEYQAKSVRRLFSRSDHRIQDVDWLLPHQANLRIMNALARELNLDRDRLLSNIETHGNTSAASIPVLLDEERRNNRFQNGEYVLLTAFGSGLRFGSALLEVKE